MWFYVVYATKLRLFVFVDRTLRLFCRFSVSLAYKCLVFSIVFGCFNALKMSGFNVFMLQVNVSKTEISKNGYSQVKALKTG